jgi:AcrR family transcriptional regulator
VVGHSLGSVTSSHVAAVHDDRAGAPTAAQARIIATALELFAKHGVGGTSLQMIADDIGVTKAAVYHQYRTKDEIVLAAAEAELERLDAVVAAAEAEPTSKRARDALVSGMVDLAIERRRTVGTLLNDPVIGGLFVDHGRFLDVMDRLQRLLIGDGATPEANLRTAMLIAAVSGAVMHPFVVDLDDEVLRVELLRLARRFLGLAS